MAHPAPGKEELAAGHARMVARLAQLAEEADVDDVFVGTLQLPELRAALAQVAPDRHFKRRFDLLCSIGMEELRLGATRAAIEAFEEACGLIPRIAGALTPEIQRRARFQRALAWLRLGETENCVARHTSQSCLLPIGPEGVHVEQQGSRRAIELLGELLAADPEDLEARWLLNLAYMTVGEYPDGVPPAQLVPPALFASDEPFPRFVDVAPELGLNAPTLAGGVVLDDFDGDDVLDVLVSDMSPRGPLQLFRGRRDGSFVERTREAGLVGITGGLNLVQADFDGDGALDVFVPRGAWKFRRGTVPASLLWNRGGTFVDVTYTAGLAEPAYPSQVGAWADFDRDGDLDLFKGNEWSTKLEAPCQLFENRGDGTFADVGARAGVRNERFCKGAAWGDADADGDPDLYVSNLGEPNRYYRNGGDGTFADVAEALGVAGPQQSFPVWFWDFDNDGALDLYVASYNPELRPFVADLLGRETRADSDRLYRGDGKGGFSEVGRALGLDAVGTTMGANFGDLDSDGFLDFYLGTGFPQYEGLVPNVMYWNRGGQRFADVTTAGGFGHLQKGHAIAFADLDRDGDQDVFAEMGGAYKGDAFGNALFRNPGFGNRTVTLVLVGVKSNRAAIGARIRCDLGADGGTRSVYRHVSSGGSFGANPLRQAIGVGRAESVETLVIEWPSGAVQTFRDVPAGRTYRVTEGVDELVAVE
ncbi:MAG TPA: CRTAC1 family protein [Planctomycetota bacterium]